MEEIRFLHVADLHLDSPFKGISSIPKERWIEVRESTFQAFQRLIDYAVKSKPDFVLIAGDIYDGENRSLRAQHIFQQGMEKLHKEDIPVFLCHGNHDHLSGSWVRFQLPGNVHVFPEQVETKTITVRGQKVHVSSFSYKERHMKEPMHIQYPTAQGEDIYIGMLHGSVEGDQEHDVYAPFRVSDLLEKQYHYWALGHIHKRQLLHADPPIVYPGNLQSRHRKEKGLKGFYEVTLSKQKAKLEFLPSSAVLYDEVEVSCKGIIHANELLEKIDQSLQSYGKQYGSAIVEIKLTNIDEETFELIQGSSKEEWLQIVQEGTNLENGFLIITDLHIQNSFANNKETSMILSIMEEWDVEDWKQVLKELYQHPKGSRYLPKADDTFIEEIITEAEEALSKTLERRI